MGKSDMEEIYIKTDYINLMQLLKLSGAASCGGAAKLLIDEKKVLVNGEPELKKRRKLYDGFIVETCGKKYKIIKQNAD